jgi:hypothetical protein
MVRTDPDWVLRKALPQSEGRLELTRRRTTRRHGAQPSHLMNGDGERIDWMIICIIDSTATCY